MLILRNFRHTFRRFALANTLNIVGLTVAFTSFFIIMTQVEYDWNFDHDVPDYQNIIRVNTRNEKGEPETWVSRPMANIIATVSPHVIGHSLMAGWTEPAVDLENEDGDKFNDIELAFGFDDFWSIAQPEMIVKGDSVSRRGILISESMANRFFGTADCIGRKLFNKDRDYVEIAGVYRDMPLNSTFGNYAYKKLSPLQDEGKWNNWNYTLYIRLDDIANADEVMRLATKEILKAYPYHNEEYDAFLGSLLNYTPLADVHFSAIGTTAPASKMTLWILIAISVVIIVIATINYMNFNLGETPMRIRSLNTQRVLGAETSTLRLGLVGESVMVSLIAFCVAVLLISIMRGLSLSDFVEGDISLTAHPLLAVCTLGISILAGVLAGLYPAIYATSIKPAVALKGSFGLGKSGRALRTGLLCLQFIVAYSLIICTSMMYAQSRHIHTADYGFDKEAILYGELSKTLRNKQDAVINELNALPCVESASISNFAIGTSDSYQYWGRGEGEREMHYYCLPVDYHYLKTMGIKVTEGRDFNESDDGVYIFNEAARRKYDFLRVGERPTNPEDMMVVGFCEDFNFRTLRAETTPSPMALCIYPKEIGSNWFNRLNVRIAKGVDKVEARHAVENKLNELNGADYDSKARYADEAIQQAYTREARFNKQMLLFAALAITIGIVGVFGMTMFESEYRRREIGIRKVMGGSTGEILSLFCRRYAWMLIGSFAVGAPMGYLLSQHWLDEFADKVAFSPLIFLAAFVAVAFVTLTTVIIQAWGVANSNPADAVKAS